MPAQHGPFTLSGRVDRIEFLADDAAAIIDYKTGRTPSLKQVETLLSPQLPLEGAMLIRGAFPDIRAKHIAEFVHVQLTGAPTTRPRTGLRQRRKCEIGRSLSSFTTAHLNL